MPANSQANASLPSGTQLYSLRETAAILGVSRRTVQKWVASGDLPHLRLGDDGRIVRILSDDLESFIQRNMHGSSD